MPDEGTGVGVGGGGETCAGVGVAAGRGVGEGIGINEGAGLGLGWGEGTGRASGPAVAEGVRTSVVDVGLEGAGVDEASLVQAKNRKEKSTSKPRHENTILNTLLYLPALAGEALLKNT